jgi:hypothetical protein
VSHNRNRKYRMRRLRRKRVWCLYATGLGLWLSANGSSQPDLFTYKEACEYWSPKYRKGWAVFELRLHGSV